MDNLLSAVSGKISVLDALILSLLGIAIVFVVLIVLMFIIWTMGKVGEKSPEIAAKLPKLPKIKFGKKKDEEQPAPEVVGEQELAPGSCGELLLVKTEEREAAMIMAIVADSTGIPLNQLKFKSIKRIDQEEEK